MLIHTKVRRAKAYGLELAVFATAIDEAAVYLGVSAERGRWLFATVSSLQETLFPYWSVKHVRSLTKQAEDLNLIMLRKEIDGLDRKGHGAFISIDYENTDFKFPKMGTLEAGDDGGFIEDKPMATPVERVASWWNSLEGFTNVEKITPKRVSKIKVRIKEGMLESLPQLEKNIRGSTFLKGKEKWKMTFDWLIANDTNWVKVLEGNYTDKKEVLSISRVATTDKGALNAMRRKMSGK